MASAWNWWSVTSLVLAFFVMLGISSSLQFSEFLNRVKKPRGIVIGILGQFLFMPFICYWITSIFSLDANTAVGIILIGVCPGGALSNTVAYLFMCDITLSIAMTACSSVLAVFMMPLNILLYLEVLFDKKVDLDIVGLLLSICVIVVGTICGLFVAVKRIHWSIKTEKVGRVSMLLLIIGSFVSNAMSDSPLWQYSFKIYFCIFLPALCGTLFGMTFGLLFKLRKPSVMAVSIEIGMQNQLLAIAIITLTFVDPNIRNQVIAIPLLYGTFSTLWNVLLSAVVFYFGWTDAQSKSIITAWKIYRRHRRQMAYALMNQRDSDSSDSVMLGNHDPVVAKNKTVEMSLSLNNHTNHLLAFNGNQNCSLSQTLPMVSTATATAVTSGIHNNRKKGSVNSMTHINTKQTDNDNNNDNQYQTL